jgi:hypothetical protein
MDDFGWIIRRQFAGSIKRIVSTRRWPPVHRYRAVNHHPAHVVS